MPPTNPSRRFRFEESPLTCTTSLARSRHAKFGRRKASALAIAILGDTTVSDISGRMVLVGLKTLTRSF